jgi:GNAT superfamily N-acetyltransferase
MIHVEIIKPTKRELKPFIQLPFDIYKNDKNWVAPGRHDLRKTLIGKENEFFSRGIQRLFLAYDDETPVARVLAGIDLRLATRLGDSAGYISLFETFENFEYGQAVLDAAMRFLREHGATQVFGPIAPRYDLLNRGILVDGFDGPPVLQNAYNTPALPKILEKYGFQKWRDYLAYDIPTDKIPVDRILPMANRIRERFGFRVEHVDFTRSNLIRVAQDMSAVICEATPDEPGSYLPTPEDLLQLFRRVKPWVRKQSAVMAYAGNQPIGMVVGFLDSSPAMIGTDGRRTPWNWLKRVLRTSGTKTARCPMQYVVPEYQNKAVNTVLLAEAVNGAKSIGIQRIEGSLVDETHIVSINNTQSAGGKLYRRYRVYQMAL